MNPFIKKPHLSEEEKKLKEALRSFGANIRAQAQESQARTQAIVQQAYRATETQARGLSVGNFLRRHFVLAPMAGIAAVVVLFIVLSPSSRIMTSVPPYNRYASFEAGISESADSSSVAPFMSGMGELGMGGGGGFAPQATGFVRSPLGYSERRTFKDRFLDSLGRHEASPDEIAKRGPMFEQDLNAQMITKEADVVDEVEKNMTSLKGYVSKIDRSLQGGVGHVYIQGQVPSEHLEALRITLKSLAGDEKYYQEHISAQSRTADVIAIEDETKKVEGSITYLKDAIARETDPQRKADLERQLATHEARLREREKTQASVSDRIEFADVYIDLTVLPSFWRTHSYTQMKMRFAGFDEPSITELFKINGSRILVALLRLLSYTFWIIPVILLWWFKSYRAKGLVQELE